MKRWGGWVYRRRWAVLVLSAALMAASGLLVLRGGDLRDPRGGVVEAGRASAAIDRELPKTGGSSFEVILASRTLVARDLAFRDAVAAAVAPLRSDSRVKTITTPYDAENPQAAGMISRDGHSVVVVVALKDDFARARLYLDAVEQEIHAGSLTRTVTGGVAIGSAFDHYLAADLRRAEAYSLPMSLLLLLLVFGAVVAALLPVGVGVLSILGALGGVFLLSHTTEVSQYALNIVTLIGLGVSIDYSLFLVSRYREELGRGASSEEAVTVAMGTAGRAILFSGVTVAIGLSGMLFYRGIFLASMGEAGAISVGLAVFYSLTFLPALLSILGGNVNRLSLPFARRGRGRGWHRLATAVMRRPMLVLVPTVAFILLAGSPFFHIRLANGDVEMLPPRAQARRGYEQLIRDFPGQDQNQYLVVVQFPGSPLTAARVGATYDLSRTLGRLPNVLRVRGLVTLDPSLTRADYQRELTAPNPPAAAADSIHQSVGKDIVEMQVLSTRPAQSDAARELLRAIRAHRTVGDGTLSVTGRTAFDVDYIQYIVSKSPLAVVYIVAVTIVVLFLLLGSVLLPLKAVVMNFLSLSASFGALVWIFQDGHLSHALGFTAASIDPTIPVLLFCIVFGLSMDYEVLLLSRMKEEWERTGDNRHAVAEGLERSGRLISGAAGIMAAVFLAFGLADVVLIKAIGLGMAIAVIIDATVVRALIVPATMRLLGNLNWWAPSGLTRFYRRIGLGEGHAGRRPGEPAGG
ncbi:MAG: MMPL family transporter [Candidatus Dormibacteria bacterium]